MLTDATLFLFRGVLPRSQAASFGISFQNVCAKPLAHITTDISQATFDATHDQNNDNAFVIAMTKDAAIFHADASAASGGDTNAVYRLTISQTSYQHAADDCLAQFAADAHFLAGGDGIVLPATLPAPLGGQKLSAQGLLQESAQIVQGMLPNSQLKLPASSMSQVVTQILNAALGECSPVLARLAHESAQVQSTAYAPFKPKTTFPTSKNC